MQKSNTEDKLYIRRHEGTERFDHSHTNGLGTRINVHTAFRSVVIGLSCSVFFFLTGLFNIATILGGRLESSQHVIKV